MMERATEIDVYGCGSSSEVTLNIQTTTGGNFSVNVNTKHTVEHLKKLVSKKLKVSKDRICLLHREKQLRDGTLEDNGIQDGARIILLPSVETGLLSQRPENSVMQALESLNDSQVNDFLSGKSPLNLTMRLGDHTMLIQLQLSTLTQGGSKTQRTTSKKSNSQNCPNTSTSIETKNTESPSASTPKKISTKSAKEEKLRNFLRTQDIVTLQNAFEIFKSLAEYQETTDQEKSLSENESDRTDTTDSTNTTLSDTSFTEQSPIKSLSNLVCGPLDDTYKDEAKPNLKFESGAGPSDRAVPLVNEEYTPNNVSKEEIVTSTSMECNEKSESSTFTMETPIDDYPMENLFNNAIDKGLFTQEEATSKGETRTVSESNKNKRLHYLLHKTSKLKHPITQNKQKAFMQSVVTKLNKKEMQQKELPQALKSERHLSPRKLPLLKQDDAKPSTSKQSIKMETANESKDEIAPVSDTKALFEASKNLTQTLKKLSKEVFTNKVELSNGGEEVVRSKIGPGAVIESMKHHGKGIYSGTFSGTLNPALQDRFGRPKRDISTIIHILNDLLCATPSITPTQDAIKPSTSSQQECPCGGCHQSSCIYGQCDGHYDQTSTGKCPCEQQIQCQCKCSRLQAHHNQDEPMRKCIKCGTDKNFEPSTEMCKKCHTANNLAIENSKTKCKLDQLRLVMQQKKERREARKMKSLPYPAAPPGKINPQEQQPKIPEEIDTVA